MDPINYHKHIQKRKWLKKFFLFLIIIFVIIPITIFFAYFFISGVPEKFKVGQVFEIQEGSAVSEIADFLEKENYIKSAMTFKIYDKWINFKNKNISGIKAGKYLFKNELDIFGVYRRLNEGISGIDDINIRIPNGEPNFVIANIFEKNNDFKNFSKEKFIRLAEKYEGYLYPDTYSFSPYVTEETIIKTMKDNFYKKNEKIINKIERSNKSLDKILVMASLIEKEANGYPLSLKQYISGILWKRIAIGMPLQVDAVFSYINKEHLSRVLYSHLEVESPYNTYKYKGLPPSPIGNPSSSSLEAALYPVKTNDLFYITGKDRKFYYSKTMAGHSENIKKYRTNYTAPIEENINLSETKESSLEE